MKIGWTLNVVIMESELTMDARCWYLQKANVGGLSKAELLRMIESAAHLEISLDESKQDWYTKENDECSERMQREEYPVYLPWQYINKNLRMLDVPYFFVVGRYCLLPTYYFLLSMPRHDIKLKIEV